MPSVYAKLGEKEVHIMKLPLQTNTACARFVCEKVTNHFSGEWRTTISLALELCLRLAAQLHLSPLFHFTTVSQLLPVGSSAYSLFSSPVSDPCHLFRREEPCLLCYCLSRFITPTLQSQIKDDPRNAGVIHQAKGAACFVL